MTEFARTEPTDEAEKTNLCRRIIENSDGDPVLTTSPITNKYWIDSPNLCQSDRILWEADYRRGDTALYSSGGTSFANDPSAVSPITPSGISITRTGDYIKYDGVNLADIKGKTITISTLNGVGTTSPASNTKFYIADFGNLKIYMNSTTRELNCKTTSSESVCDPAIAKMENTAITIQLPATLTPTQMIFGNAYLPSPN